MIDYVDISEDKISVLEQTPIGDLASAALIVIEGLKSGVFNDKDYALDQLGNIVLAIMVQA